MRTAIAGITGLVTAAGSASGVIIDLSGAISGETIVAPGGSFAGSFVGQTVNGISLDGSPAANLTLQAGTFLQVDFFNGFNTILPQPDNTAPLAVLLDSEATDISWEMGSASGGSVLVEFWADDGSLVNSETVALVSGYSSYSFGSFGPFQGVTISENDDGAGLRYFNFEYTPIPMPGTIVTLGGLSGLIVTRRRR